MIRAFVMAPPLVLILALLAVRGDDGKPADAKQPQKSPDGKDSAPAPDQAKKAPASAPTPAQLKEVLENAIKMTRSLDERPAKKDGVFALDGIDSFAMRLSKELQADTVRAIGRAQGKLKDLSAARASWQSALDICQEISSIEALKDRSEVCVQVATDQDDAGEQVEAKITLRQALQAARSIKEQSGIGIPVDLMDGDQDPLYQKAKLLARIARLQTTVGDKTSADETFKLAIQTAETLEKPLRKVRALLEIAKGGPAERVKTLWATALENAMAIKDEYPRAKAVELLVRAQVESLPIENTISLVSERLKDDLQHYAIWAVADAVASSEKVFAQQSLSALSQLALKVQFDRPTKKITVFRRIAEAQARLGDFEGAYRTAGEPHPINDVQNFRAMQARLNVMKAVAEAQLKMKQRTAALDTTQAALEVLAPLAGEDAESYFPLASFGSLQARCGDVAGAVQTADALSSISWRVYILCEIAKAHAEAGRRDQARKIILRTFDETKRAPNESLWANASSDNEQIRAFASDMDPTLPIMQVIAQTQAEIGDADAARKVVADMGKSSTAEWIRSATIEKIVEAQLKAGDSAGALKMTELLPDGGRFSMGGSSKSKLLEAIAKKQSQDGQASTVLEWAGKQTVPDAKLHAIRGMADGIVERVTPREAKPKGSSS